MVDQVIEILKNDVEVVLKSPLLSLSLLKCYSTLYINGRAPRACSRSQRIYYNKLKTDGMARAEKVKAAKSRKCIPAWKGNCYSSRAAKHFSSIFITDEEATKALLTKQLQESQFKVLPDGYDEAKELAEKEAKEAKDATIELVEVEATTELIENAEKVEDIVELVEVTESKAKSKTSKK